MSKQCRTCKILLDETTTFKSFIDYGINLCRNCEYKYTREQYIENRLLIIKKLGEKCECCGESNTQLLSIDHINGGGNIEKKALRGKSYLKKLKHMTDIKTKYRCLCYNCNYCIGFWGKCQHKI